jgi:hypothetical protein
MPAVGGEKRSEVEQFMWYKIYLDGVRKIQIPRKLVWSLDRGSPKDKPNHILVFSRPKINEIDSSCANTTKHIR